MALDAATLRSVALFWAFLMVPGWAVLRVFRVEVRDPVATLGLAAATGLAAQPLVYLWLRLAGIRATAASWWVILGLAAVVGVRATGGRWPGRGAGIAPSPSAGPLVALAVAAAALVAGWWSAWGMVVPRWGDSVHHTAAVDLFLRANGLPTGWQPYAALDTFSYHFGFHALAATLAATAGIPPHQAVVVAGQMLVVAGVLTAYALGRILAGRPWVGAGAALAAGGLSTMPAFYVNWGRYTQLAGQVILPAAAAATVLAARQWQPASGAGRGAGPGAGRGAKEDRPSRWGLLALAALLVAGLALTHYIVTLFFGLLIVAWLVVGEPGRQRRRLLVPVALVAALAVAMAAPWIGPFAAGPLASYAVGLATTQVPNPSVWGVNPDAAVWGRWRELVGLPLAAAMLLGAVAAVARRDRGGLVGVLWTAGLVGATNPGRLGLPVTGLIKPFTVAISLYAAGALAVGALVDAGAAWVTAALANAKAASGPGARGRREAVLVALAAAILASALVWGRHAVLDEAYRLVTTQDRAALDWVAANTPADAVFLVSGFAAFGDTVVAGDDAGWWLPYWTGRRGTVPPILYGSERPVEAGYREGVNRLTALWHDDLDAPATRAALREAHVTHAFVGEVARRNDRAGGGQGLAEALASSPYWSLIHEAGDAQVWAFTGGDDAG